MDNVQPTVTGSVAESVSTEAPATDVNPVQAPEAPKSDDMAKRLAMLAKKESQIRSMEQKYKAELEAERSKMKAEYEPFSKYKNIEDRLKSKDMSALKELGFDYNEYTQYLLNGEQETPKTLVERAKAEMKAEFEKTLAAKDEETRKSHQELLENQQKQAENAFKSDIKEALQADFDASESKWQFLGLQDRPEDIVYEIIDAHYRQTKEKTGKARVLKTEEAADIAEKYYEAEAEKRFKKAPKLKTLTDKLFGAPAPAAPEAKPGLFQSPKTLSNTVVNAPPTKRYSYEESLDNAAKMLKWS